MGKTVKENVKKIKEKKQMTQIKKQNNKMIETKKNTLKIDLFIKNLKQYLTKESITFFILFLLDIILVIYLAKKNIVNYVVVLDDEIFISRTRYILWGRNYINVIATIFFYVYICLVNRFYLRRKNSKKFLCYLLCILLVLNVLLFILFTKRVY